MGAGGTQAVCDVQLIMEKSMVLALFTSTYREYNWHTQYKAATFGEEAMASKVNNFL